MIVKSKKGCKLNKVSRKNRKSSKKYKKQKGGALSAESLMILREYISTVQTHNHTNQNTREQSDSFLSDNKSEISKHNSNVIKKLSETAKKGKKLIMCIGAGNRNIGTTIDKYRYTGLVDVGIETNPSLIDPVNEQLLALCDFEKTRTIYNEMQINGLNNSFKLIFFDISVQTGYPGGLKEFIGILSNILPLLIINGIFIINASITPSIVMSVYLDDICRDKRMQSDINLYMNIMKMMSKEENKSKTWLSKFVENNPDFEVPSPEYIAKHALPDDEIYVSNVRLDKHKYLSLLVEHYNKLAGQTILEYNSVDFDFPQYGTEKTDDKLPSIVKKQEFKKVNIEHIDDGLDPILIKDSLYFPVETLQDYERLHNEPYSQYLDRLFSDVE
jgi:hypothetical protein